MISALDEDEQLRRWEFPICARKTYLAHAADAPLPRRVADAMHASIEDASRNQKVLEETLALIARTRTGIAQLVGAEADEISLTGPTSAGLSVIANGLCWRPGDEVVCYLDEYPANVYPWLALERRGVNIVLLEPRRVGEITAEIVEQALTERTRLVALASANYCSGYRIDLGAIGQLCSESEVLFSVDAIQTLGAFSVCLTDVDFLSAGAQKWMLGPSGAGFLFVTRERQESLCPLMIGGWNVQSPDFIAQREITFISGGRRFEPGAYNSAAIAGMAAAIEMLAEIGIAEISERILTLTTALRERIEGNFILLSPVENTSRSGILTFRHNRVPAQELLQLLAENDVVVSLRFDRRGEGWLRISPHFYNTITEIERTAQLLRKLVGVPA